MPDKKYPNLDRYHLRSQGLMAFLQAQIAAAGLRAPSLSQTLLPTANGHMPSLSSASCYWLTHPFRSYRLVEQAEKTPQVGWFWQTEDGTFVIGPRAHYNGLKISQKFRSAIPSRSLAMSAPGTRKAEISPSGSRTASNT